MKYGNIALMNSFTQEIFQCSMVRHFYKESIGKKSFCIVNILGLVIQSIQCFIQEFLRGEMEGEETSWCYTTRGMGT